MIIFTDAGKPIRANSSLIKMPLNQTITLASTSAISNEDTLHGGGGYLEFVFKNLKVEVWAVITFLILSIAVSISKRIYKHKHTIGTTKSTCNEPIRSAAVDLTALQHLTEGGEDINDFHEEEFRNFLWTEGRCRW